MKVWIRFQRADHAVHHLNSVMPWRESGITGNHDGGLEVPRGFDYPDDQNPLQQISTCNVPSPPCLFISVHVGISTETAVNG